MECKQCGIELNNPRALYCGDKCRMQYKRRRPEQIDPNRSQPEHEQIKSPEQVDNPLGGVLYDDLYRAVCCYPGVTWKQSPEYAEIMYRLHNLTVEELESEGQFVPCWKYAEEAA